MTVIRVNPDVIDRLKDASAYRREGKLDAAIESLIDAVALMNGRKIRTTWDGEVHVDEVQEA